MAPPKRKTRGWLKKEGIIEPRYSYRQRRKRPDIPRRVQNHQTINVPELVYRLLTIDKHNQDSRGNKVSKSRGRLYRRMQKQGNYRESSYDTSNPRESADSAVGSEYRETGDSSSENLTEMIDATNSSGAMSSENSSVSNISVEPITLANSINTTRALLRKKSLLQIINNYIKAGIEEGKRRAKKYIRKALSFGVKSGYLIPADPEGQVIRVSSTLLEFRKTDPESRKRRNEDEVNDEPRAVERKRPHRETSPWTTKSEPRRDNSTDVATRRKRKRVSTLRSPRINLNLTGRKRRKTTVDLVRNGGKKTRTTGKKNPKTVNKRQAKSRSKYKNEDEGQKPIKERVVKSSSVHKSEKDNRQKSLQDRSEKDQDSVTFEENEINQRTMIERRKSPPSREGSSRGSDGGPSENLMGENDQETAKDIDEKNDDCNIVTNDA